jgi:UDP-glucose 4-epimerase
VRSTSNSPSAATIFGDGLASRDFVYVDDVVAANIAAAGLRATPYGEYNVGSGREVTILQLARMVREASGVKPGSRAVCFEKARAGEVRHSCLDVSRIRRDLDLPPPVPLASGIERTLEWACAASLDSCGKSA